MREAILRQPIDHNKLFAAILNLPGAGQDHSAQVLDLDAALNMFRAFVALHGTLGYRYDAKEWAHFRADYQLALDHLRAFGQRLPAEAPRNLDDYNPIENGDPCADCEQPVWFCEAEGAWYHCDPAHNCFLASGRAQPPSTQPLASRLGMLRQAHETRSRYLAQRDDRDWQTEEDEASNEAFYAALTAVGWHWEDDQDFADFALKALDTEAADYALQRAIQFLTDEAIKKAVAS